MFPLDEFRTRLGVSESDQLTLNALEELQRAHVYSLPFENLDIQLGREISLEPAVVDEKLLRKRRGGYCFELNGLFLRALSCIGFRARPVLGRVHLTGEPSGRLHQATLVELNGDQWLVDVGFGSACPRVPMKLGRPEAVDHDGAAFRLIEHALGFMLQKHSDDRWSDLYSFDLTPVMNNDIAVANYYTSTSPRALFTRARMIAIGHPTGETRVLNYRRSVLKNGVLEVGELSDTPDYLREVERLFGIELDATYAELKALPPA